MLTMRIMPKMSERPPARRKRRAPYETPLKSWLIQKSTTAVDCTIGAPAGWPRRSEEAHVRLPHERFDYSPMAARRPWKIPKPARLAGGPIAKLEKGATEKPMPRGVLSAPQGVATVPDV